MSGKVLCCLYIACYVMLWLPWADSAAYPESQLQEDLFRNYNNKIRPVADASERVMVFVSISIGRIESLDEKHGKLTMFGFLGVGWNDPRLAFSPSEYSGVEKLVVPAESIWLPEINLLNSVDEAVDYSFDSEFRVYVFPDGTVNWLPSFKWQSSCQTKLKRFPFDEQECKLVFISWLYPIEQQMLVNSTSEPFYDAFVQNFEWRLKDATVKQVVVEVSGFLISQIHVDLYLSRNPEFFVWTVVIPSILISILTIFVFLLPSDSGEKIGLAITVLLGYTIVLLMISDITPRTSTAIPAITIYLIVHMCMGSLAIFVCVLILRIFHHRTGTPVPKWLYQLTINRIGKMVCMTWETDLQHHRQFDNHMEVVDFEMSNTEEVDEKTNRFTSITSVRDWITQTLGLSTEYSKLFDRLQEREKTFNESKKNASDWKKVAAILDRSVMYVYFFANFITVIILVCIFRTDMITDTGH